LILFTPLITISFFSTPFTTFFYDAITLRHYCLILLLRSIFLRITISCRWLKMMMRCRFAFIFLLLRAFIWCYVIMHIFHYAIFAIIIFAWCDIITISRWRSQRCLFHERLCAIERCRCALRLLMRCVKMPNIDATWWHYWYWF